MSDTKALLREAAIEGISGMVQHLPADCQLFVVACRPGKADFDLVLPSPEADLNNALDALRRQGLSIDGTNIYKQAVCDLVVGAMVMGKQNTNPPPAGHWGQQFWDIGRAEGELQEEMKTLLRRLVQWDLDYPVNCYDGYAGLKALNQIIADAKTVIAKTPA